MSITDSECLSSSKRTKYIKPYVRKDSTYSFCASLLEGFNLRLKVVQVMKSFENTKNNIIKDILDLMTSYEVRNVKKLNYIEACIQDHCKAVFDKEFIENLDMIEDNAVQIFFADHYSEEQVDISTRKQAELNNELDIAFEKLRCLYYWKSQLKSKQEESSNLKESLKIILQRHTTLLKLGIE